MYFDKKFRSQLKDLFLWRRDVRRFESRPVDDNVLQEIISQAMLAPSVGLSQPWRFIQVDNKDLRQQIIHNYEIENDKASKIYSDEKATLYRSLKLSGLKEAPIHLAIFAEQESEIGSGLGRQTMPETIHYSVVTAIENLWLAARANGIGMGWVSILDPIKVSKTLDTPDHWHFIGYMCIGYPQEEHTDSELIRSGWEKVLDTSKVFFKK